MTTAFSPSWEVRALEKKANILTPLPKAYIHPHLSHSTTSIASIQSIPSQLLSPQELEITSLPFPTLLTSLSNGTYTSTAVLHAYIHRAAIAHQLLNCCLDFPYTRALSVAAKLDEAFTATGKTVGPLHGLPVSVKDQVRVRGSETTCGFVANLGRRDERDSLLVEILERAGAVVFVKTNLSMGCMWGETVNK